jgi:hypothetical protein
VVLVLAVGGACGGGPDASVGVGRADGEVVVRAKACPGDGGRQDVGDDGDDGTGPGMARIDVVDPQAPEEAVWSAVADEPDAARRTVPVAPSVEGYEVEDRRPDGALPDRRLRVLVEGPDGETWGGPRFRPDDLQEGVLRVAGQDVDLDEWESEPARCPDVGLGAALVGGAATALAAGVLWLVVRLVTRATRRRD